jgi:anti-sigma regulatory factor (Ser/Thr protein kinase)
MKDEVQHPEALARVSDRAAFVRPDIVADAMSAARTRVEFGGWLRSHFTLGDDRYNDLLLAVYEALANAAEYAYVDAPRPGIVGVTAAYAEDSDTLVVTVVDRGSWRTPLGDRPANLRGRGIPLMHALADEATIEGTPTGTEVRLAWFALTNRLP